MTLGAPRCLAGLSGLQTAQTHCSLQNYFHSFLFIIHYVGLNYLFTFLLLENSNLDIQTLLTNSGRNTPSSAQLSCWIGKTKATLQSLLCWDTRQVLFNSCGQSHPASNSEFCRHTFHLLWVFFTFWGFIGQSHWCILDIHLANMRITTVMMNCLWEIVKTATESYWLWLYHDY